MKEKGTEPYLFRSAESREAESSGMPKNLNADQTTILSYLELTDSSTQLDTVSVSGSLLTSAERLFDLLDRASSGKAFTRPCVLYKRYVSSEESFCWELPNWFFSLPIDTHPIAGAVIERAIWLSYAVFYAGIERCPCPVFRETESTSNLWKSLTAKQRNDIVLAVQKEVQSSSSFPVAILKEGAEKAEIDPIARLTFLPLKDLIWHKASRFAIETIKSCSVAPAMPYLAQILAVKPAFGGRQKLTNEFSTFEDELLNTSISTQISGKSKCGSRKGSTDDSIVSTLTFWMYGEDDYEMLAIKTTGKIMANILDKLGEDTVGTESELEFFAELEKEMEKVKAVPTELGEVVKECDIIKVFWGDSKKKNKKELKMFEKEECKISNESPKEAIKIEMMLNKEPDKNEKRKMQADFKEVVEEQKTESELDVHSARKPWKMLAKQRYDYLKMPKKSWPLRPTNDHISSTSFFVPGTADSAIKAGSRDEEILSITSASESSSSMVPSSSWSQPFTAVSEQMSIVLSRLETYHKILEPYRKQLVTALAKAIQRHISQKKVDVEIYGSVKHGLAIEKSDVDLRLIGLNTANSGNSIEILKVLEKKIRSERYIKSTTLITTAKVPVIKLVSSYIDFIESRPLTMRL